MNAIKGMMAGSAALMILGACANEAEPNDATNNTSDSEQHNNEENNDPNDAQADGDHEDILNLHLQAAPVSLDPHGANDGNSLYVMNPIYDTLVELNTDLELQPALAEHYEPLDETTWQFELREDVTFHDGSPFNADVVKANLDRVRDPDLASPLGFLFDMIDEVEVVDDYTVTITTDFPFSALPSHLAHPGGHMVSLEQIEADRAHVEDGGEPFVTVSENPIGTGYMKFDSQTPGESVSLVRHDGYWADPAGVEAITFSVTPEDLTRVGELETGSAQIIYPVNANDISRINSNDGTSVLESPSANLTYLGMNTEAEPFDDIRVRQAISMAVNKQDVIEIATDGVALEANGPLAPTVIGYSENVSSIGFDPEEAKALLAEAGYPDGFSTTITSNDGRAFIDIAETAQSNLREIGIDAEIETMETGTYLDVTGQGDSELFVGSWGTVTLDADYGLYAMFHSSNAGAPGNRSFLANDEIDALLEAARQETDEQERLALYEEVQQLIADEAPMVFLYHSVLLAGLEDRVDGFFQYPSSFPYLKDVRLTE
ncbi:glutathione ABC transporter substrate-binding protein [Salisediminibacterium selenitireducens]|uniref:Extracellular solute-binding protein family 5 n=1 Tax=Bacillus selenitireducens (strain ATCC 700615 / DSM 15326 / MLS10) TaxID=439292 RepID=D6XZG6_BACIE|nr:glutathione ABC transporter substrate-binding protein [Salisediminibacterium selenitireducens]ADH98340.1 extracellular solute-binding protein family 5 [[Bacillus] selenitireducens MLS10]